MSQDTLHAKINGETYYIEINSQECVVVRLLDEFGNDVEDHEDACGLIARPIEGPELYHVMKFEKGAFERYPFS